MLSGVLTGLREARAPMAAGLMWSAVFLLGSALVVPGLIAGSPSNSTDDLVALVEAIGQPGMLVISGFVAYLVGVGADAATWILILWIARSHLLRFPRPDSDPPPKGWHHRSRPMSHRSKRRAFDWASQRSAASAGRTKPTTTDFKRAERVVRDVLYVGTRLLADSKDLYDEYSRHVSEARLRYAVALPLPLFVTILAGHLGFWWPAVLGAAGLGAGLGTALLLDGLFHFRTAHSIVAHSIADGTITSGEMDSVEQRWLDRLPVAEAPSEGLAPDPK